MKSKIILTILISAIAIVCTQAQENKVWGKILDETGTPLANATILLLRPSDSSYVTGTISNDTGDFMILDFPAIHCLMEVSMLGYRKEYRPFTLKGSVDAGTIRLQEDSYLLSGVTVTAQKPYIEMESGKMTINLSSSILGSDSDLVEALRNLPGVLLRDDGSIILNGQSGATILIDNKATHLTGDHLISYLRSIPSATVENIELITSPSARYDAAGVSGIINIRTKKRRVEGVALPIYIGYNQGKYGRGYGGFSLNIRKNRLLLNTSYSCFQGVNFNDGRIDRTTCHPVSGQLSDIRLLQDTYRKYNNKRHYYQITMELDVTEKTVLSAYNRGNFYQETKNEEMTSSFHTGTGPADSLFTTRNRNHKDQNTYAAGTMLTWRPYTQAEWATSADYQYFRFNEDQYSEGRANHLPDTPPGLLRGDLKGDIAMYSAETTASLPFSERYKLETGAKTTFVYVDNTAAYQRNGKDQWTNDNELSNGFMYRDNINAGYLQLTAGLSTEMKIEAGVRVENTRTRSTFITYPEKGRTIVKQQYTHFFPRLRIDYRISDNNSIGVGYGRRIIRPNYRDLNPFIEVRDTYLYEQGNTQLKPELIDNIDLTWIHKNRFATSLLFSYTHDPITQTYIAIDDKNALITPSNLNHNWLIGLRLHGANLRPAPFWNMNMTGTIYYKHYEWEIYGTREKNRQLTPLADLNNEFTLSQTWKAELSGMFYGKMAEGQAIIKPIWTVNGALQKSLFDNKASIRIQMNDMFLSLRHRMQLKSPSLYGSYRERAESSHIGIHFTYRFHTGKEAKDSARKNSIDESKRINL